MARRRKSWPKSRWGIVNAYRSTRRRIARGPGNGVRGYIAASRRIRRRKYGY